MCRFTSVWMGAAFLTSCVGQVPAGTPPSDASLDSYAGEDTSGSRPIDAWHLDVPHEFSTDDGSASNARDGDLPETGMDGSTSDGSVCPIGVGPLQDTCKLCPGAACSAGQECNSSYHSGGPASTHCICVNGRMQCCFQDFVNGWSSYSRCAYGNLPPPACPTSPPRIGDPCGPDLQLCGLPSCCSTFPLSRDAYCDGTRWSPARSAACNSVPTGACSGQPRGCTGTGFSCDCSDRDDAGIMTWRCDGPG